ncbi:NAD(P)H-nitrite reductase [Thermanaerovibrio velox DSM 12556]|uniref:NAD(P)H-nitrite reductase n=1 Tax=Thermanaerovibrio velox DSM 12556 TaxID=926567 RepID=H0UQP4_9BACT|nr:(2Fe-2S)-binding protein [Thermanaerovibrio velox]EHM10808.1 NAD(P)H-nitrite reductase [Thermanaerovibrio velox DSM 12556]
MNDPVVCWCSNVTEGDIIRAVEKGARTLEDVKAMTGACTLMRCKELHPEGRCCSKDIRDLLSRVAVPQGDEPPGCG